jgi:hypothetical protein
VQRDDYTTVDLGDDALQPVEVKLAWFRAGGAVVAVEVADRGGEDVDVCGEEVCDVGGGRV